MRKSVRVKGGSGGEGAWEDVRSTRFEIRYSVEEEVMDSWSTGDAGVYKRTHF
jgi:hypothetical protein